MSPRLQRAFDVAYSKAEPFIARGLQKKCLEFIREGDCPVAAGIAVDAMLSTPNVRPEQETLFRAAVAAFGAFWDMFTEETCGTKKEAR